MSCLDTLLTWLLYLAVLSGTFYAFKYQFWVGVVLTVPALLGDVIIKRTHRRAAFVVKLLLLFQTVMMWSILPWATFHGFDSSQMSPHVVSIIKATQDSIPVSREMIAGTISNWIPKLGFIPALFMSQKTELIVEEIFGNLSSTNFPDLKYRSKEEVRNKYKKIFSELPKTFEPTMRNPCWFHEATAEYSEAGSRSTNRAGSGRVMKSGRSGQPLGNERVLSCLPYVYLLGQPKSGTSDLYERLVSHPDVVAPSRKEIRWFTRGEFTTERIPEHQLLNEDTSIFTYTTAFSGASTEILNRYEQNIQPQAITIDGGPHTLWWPTQSPDGELVPGDIPPAQIIREIQPSAKFLITVSDPVHRMYSDYYFLDDSLRPVENLHRHAAPDAAQHVKSPQEFHERALKQVTDFQRCVELVEVKNPELGWFRASQICAHDRKRFGVGGWGRLNIGLYVAFIEKWLEHFSLSQFHVVRLEDFHADPRAYMKGVLEFLGLRGDMSEDEWGKILASKVYNQHKMSRPEMLSETDRLLRDFYQPYNDLLAKLLNSKKYRWLPETEVHSLSAPDFQADVEQANSYNEREDKYKRVHKVVQPGVRGMVDESRLRPGDSVKWLDGGLFSLDGLDMPDPDTPINQMSRRSVDPSRRPAGPEEAGKQLCVAAFAMDLQAVKILLIDHKIHGSVTHEFGRNAFHCLAALNLNVDGHSKSHIFHLLKGEEGYLTSILDPPLPLKMESTIGLEIIKSLEHMVIKIGKWLLRAGTEVDLPDDNGVTALIFASVAGSEILIKFLLENGADVNAKTLRDERTAAHYAAAYGHTNVLKLLLDYGSNLDEPDFAGVTARQIISVPGPVFSQDAKEVLGIDQEPVRTIERQKYYNPYDINIDLKVMQEPSNIGGFDGTRLKGYENTMNCDADQYDASEISGRDIYEKYMARSRPILIRGLINDWPAAKEYTRFRLYNEHGKLPVTVTSIPYADKFHGEGTTTMSLSKYMDQVMNHSVVGGIHPWYVFIGHPLKGRPSPPRLRGGSRAEKDQAPADEPMGRTGGEMLHTHLVDYETVPTPRVIQEMQELITKGPSAHFDSDYKDRKGFINAQWAYGGAGTGAPVHYHNTAWNALLYGAKYWVMYPPHTLAMSNKQILQFIEEDLPYFQSIGHKPLTCVQTAGDVMIIPESWSHGVLNIQESVAVATELENFHWRIKPGSRVILDAIPAKDPPHMLSNGQ